MKKLLVEKLSIKQLISAEQDLVKEFYLTAILIVLSILLPFLGISQKGKDGNFSTTASTLVNKYVTLASSASAGATSITVSNIAHLSRTDATAPNTNLGTSVYAANALAAGDLVMIIQMQGADMTTTDDAAYGTITAYNNTGNYELKTVLSVAGNVITFCEALTKSYGATGRQRTQVVRMPRFNNLTVNATHTISAASWQGSKGGICAMEVNGNLVMNGQISATGAGFRGSIWADVSPNFGNATYRSTVNTNGALKGESIVGNTTDYNGLNGQYGRGAPANGGGGGDNHNAGGGGGSNAGNNGNLTPWNGTGIKASGFNTAWNLEATGFATDISRGGGRGGYTYTGTDGDANSWGPGNTSWGGDTRRNVGGFGGRPLDYNSNTRLFMGGGGGAGDANNTVGGSGGNGGGIVYLLVAGTVTGSTFIRADGNNGTAAGSAVELDGAGGGGGGGSVVLLCNSTITSIAISANGGNGGNETYAGVSSSGPGGGGGGGYILTTTTGVTRTVTGGNNGVTSSSAITEFTPNGATSGDAGTIATGSYTEINSCFKEINGLSSPSCTYSAITVGASNTILNTYYPATASASVGATRITIGSRNTAGASTPISSGDLLLVIQMQGSTINSTNTSAYGSGGTSYNGYLTTVAGTYEYVYAASGLSAGGNGTIYLTTPLRNSYTSAAYSAGVAGQYTYQVIRVPEYSSMTINAGSSLTAAAWDGSSGGVLAVNVNGNLALGTGITIDVSGKGFRGGGGRITTGNGAIRDLTSSPNSSMGEGIAGTPRYTFTGSATLDNTIEGYPNGSTGIGAPANAGGGNSSNGDGGAGGGGNMGAGGRGGRAWGTSTVDNGGYGGASFLVGSINRLILGGGGGAGTSNNGTGALGAASSSGGAGGGIIFMNVSSISGTSTINANGANAPNPDNDGAGGGGAGGSVYIYSSTSTGLSNITITAKGGNGSNAWPGIADDGTANNGNPEHGPGGGGGGGAIYTNGTPAVGSSVDGGLAGTTTSSLYAYYATSGKTGYSNTFMNVALSGTATQSSNNVPSSVASLAIDDNYNSNYNDGSVAHTNYDTNPWWMVDFSATSVVHQIVLWNRTDCCGWRLDNCIVEAMDASNNVLWSTNTGTATAKMTFNTGGVSNVKKVRVRSTGSGYLQLTEVQVFGYTSPVSTLKPFVRNKNYCDIDDDNDGITDATENPSGVDPFMDADNDGVPNVYDRTSGTVVAWVDTNSDGINDSFDADKDGRINELDIDSDNDGITDNVEAQSTTSYVIPTDTDSNGDGLMDVYAPGLTPFDFDSDGTPDYLDTDTDNDGIPDRYEGADRNQPALLTKTQTDIDTSGDTDGDGLMNIFDNVNNDNLTTNYYLNVTMGNMGSGGNFSGPTPTSSIMGLPKSDLTAGADRDWRNATILPLNIVKFAAVYNEPTAKLSWSVENEYQTSKYAVEYSVDGISFEKVGEVMANNTGKVEYSFNHVPNKNASTVYYRIKQIDKSGKEFYSKTVAIKLGKAAATVSVYPNPFVQYMNVSIGSQTEEAVVLQLISADGKVAKTMNAKLQKGLNTLQMTDMSNLAKGNYYLRISSSNIQTTQQVIKIN